MENSDLLSFVGTIIAGWTGECCKENAIDRYVSNHPDNCMIIDIFPNTINDPDKYYQVSVFYRKWVDGEIKRQTFCGYEKRYLELIKSMWLYNTVDICYNLCFNRYFRRGMTRLSPFLKSHPPADTRYNVKEWSVLENSVIFALREAGSLIMYFKEWEALVYIDDFYLLIMVKDSAILQNICSIANTSKLYMHPCSCGKR